MKPCSLPKLRRLSVEHQFSVKALAAALDTNVRQLHRWFRKRLRCAPGAWLARARRARALELLREGRLSIKQIAQALFYHSASAFIRAFRRWRAFSPWRFRKWALS